MSFSEIQLVQEAATNIEVSPSGKIINGNDGLTVVSSQKALPIIPKIAQGKTKGGLNRKSSIYNGGPDPESVNQSNRKESDKNGSNSNDTAGAGTGSGSGSESQGQGQNRRKMSKLKTVKSSKKLAKSMSKTTRSAKNSKSRSKTNNKPGPAGQHRGVSTGGKSKVLSSRSTLNPNPQNSDNNGSGSIQPIMGSGSSDLSGTGTGTATTTTNGNGTGTFSSAIPHPTVHKKSTPKAELLNILKSKSISSMSKTAPKSKSKSNTINNIRDTRIRGKSPKSGNNPSTNNKLQTQLPKHTDKDNIRNKNNLTKKNSGPPVPPPAVFTTITPAFFSRLKQIAINEGNSKSKSLNVVKDHSTGKSETNSNSKHTNNKKEKQSRSRSSRSTISFNDAREALSLKQQDVVPTVTVTSEETSAVRNNGGAVETLKTKVNLPSKQHYNMSQSQSGSPRNAKEFVSNNSLQYSQTRISSSAGAGSGSGRNSGKPILAPCHGTGCHSTTFPMKKHIRFADSDGNANHEDNHYLEMSSSYSNNTKMRSSNLMGGCLK